MLALVVWWETRPERRRRRFAGKEHPMKRIFMLLVLLALLAGCSAEAAPAMYIQPAELNEEEEAIAELLGADTDQHLFDVVLDLSLIHI